MSELTNQIRALLDEIDGTPASTRQPEVDTGQPITDYLTPDMRMFAKDYWIVGRVAAAKGGYKHHYDQGMMLTSMALSGTGIPLHYSVFKPIPELSPWSAAQVSVADLGWIDGSHYRPTAPAGANFISWVAAGCPHENQYGKFDARGEIIGPGEHGFGPGG
jgi:hypothetical protein